MALFLSGIGLLASMIGLFWLKNRLRSPLLARIAYSGLVARVAVVGGAFSMIGMLLMLADLAGR